MPHPTTTPGLRSIHNACKLHETLTCPIPPQPQTWWCTFGAESRLGPFGGCFFTGGWPTGEKMNHQIMDRWAMLKYQAIHGKTFGLFLRFPILPRKISFPKRTKRHGSQISIFTWYFFFIKLFIQNARFVHFWCWIQTWTLWWLFFYRWVTNRWKDESPNHGPVGHVKISGYPW